MEFAVCKSQAKSWEHPLVKEVQQALAVQSESDPSRIAFKGKIRDIIMTQGLRLSSVLQDLKHEYLNSELMRTFRWRFWDPMKDELQAQFMYGAIQQEPVMVGASVA